MLFGIVTWRLQTQFHGKYYPVISYQWYMGVVCAVLPQIINEFAFSTTFDNGFMEISASNNDHLIMPANNQNANTKQYSLKQTK